eukprot:356614-Chlamydomonas_euryale.AAC.1
MEAWWPWRLLWVVAVLALVAARRQMPGVCLGQEWGCMSKGQAHASMHASMNACMHVPYEPWASHVL